jgi:hypothetical protein
MRQLRTQRLARREPARYQGDASPTLHKRKRLCSRAGHGKHRAGLVFGCWSKQPCFCAIVGLQAGRWYRTFLAEHRSSIIIGDCEFPIRALSTRRERLMDAVGRTYLETYNTRGAIRYARDLMQAKSRVTTTRTRPVVVLCARSVPLESRAFRIPRVTRCLDLERPSFSNATLRGTFGASTAV